MYEYTFRLSSIHFKTILITSYVNPRQYIYILLCIHKSAQCYLHTGYRKDVFRRLHHLLFSVFTVEYKIIIVEVPFPFYLNTNLYFVQFNGVSSFQHLLSVCGIDPISNHFTPT